MRKSFFLLLLFFTTVTFLRIASFLSASPSYKEGDEVVVQMRLFSDPKVLGTNQQIIVSLASGEKAFAYVPSYPRYKFGDVLKIKGKISIKEVENGKIYFLNSPEIEEISDKNLFFELLSGSREKIEKTFEGSLSASSSSLLLGVVFGIKASFPKNFEDNLKKTGVTHVIAASGMNVSMLGGFLAGVLAYFLKRRLALMLTVLAIVLYAILAGLDASIIRASIMGILAFSAQILGRQNLSVFALYLTACLMLIISPQILKDVGFQLSFMATMGIITIKPVFDRRLGEIASKFIIGEDILTTIVAQLATLPILIYYFGTYSLWSVFTNALVLWTVPILMILGSLASISSLIFAPLASIFLFSSYPFLSFFQAIVSFFGNLSGIIELKGLPIYWILSYYFILFTVLFKSRLKL